MHTDILFWGAFALLAYTHAGYPVLLWVWARLRAREPRIEPIQPSVSVLVVAYNEAERVERRIGNLLDQDYPHDRLEIILASDGSDDATVERALRQQREGVFIAAYHARRGKPAVLNRLIPQCSGEIVVLADARQQFDRGALRALTACFADPEVGAVSGELILTDDPEGSAVGEGVGFYWKYEKFIRRNESRIDSTIGATGAIYAIRRELFEPIPEDTLLDDVLIPTQIARRGYRVVFESGARAYDRKVPTAKVEFARKARTLAGNFQLFVRNPWLLNPVSNRLWIQTVSHKACRLLSPFCLGAVLGASLSMLDRPFYRWMLGVQIALYAAALGGYLFRHSKRRIFVLSVPYAFCLLNWAVVAGLLRYISGRQRVTWETTPARARPAWGSTPVGPRRRQTSHRSQATRIQ